MGRLRKFEISGCHSRREVGVALGKISAPVMRTYLAQSPTWAVLEERWRGHSHVEKLAKMTRKFHAPLWEELEGLAEGLGMDVDDVFLWHCRGDLLWSTPDGCTSVAAVVSPAEIQTLGSEDKETHKAGRKDELVEVIVGHNEDGEPFLYDGYCCIVDVKFPHNVGAPGYISFYYPGSLPGHTFGANFAGIVQTINNIRTCTQAEGVPRIILARAVLDCSSLKEAQAVLSQSPHSGGFHHTLAGLGNDGVPSALSVEVTPGGCSIHPVERAFGHANHAIHHVLGSRDSVEGHGSPAKEERQVITASSIERQQRIDELVRAWATSPSPDDVRTALHDAVGDLPILRCDPNDPDDENTIATAIFSISLRPSEDTNTGTETHRADEMLSGGTSSRRKTRPLVACIRLDVFDRKSDADHTFSMCLETLNSLDNSE